MRSGAEVVRGAIARALLANSVGLSSSLDGGWGEEKAEGHSESPSCSARSAKPFNDERSKTFSEND